jgi:hypothetical protein
MRFIDKRIPEIMDFLRDEFEKDIIINDWHWKGNFQQRGLRDKTAKEYKPYSCHSFGRAVDFDVDKTNSLDVQKKILNEYADDLITMGVTGVEDSTSGWTHITVSDVSAWGFKKVNGIFIIPR